MDRTYVFTALALAVLGAGTPLQAQTDRPEANKLVILFSGDPLAGAEAKPNLLLRPNIKQRFYVFIQNPAPVPRKVIVKLLAGNPPSEVIESASVVVGKEKTDRVIFQPPAAPAAGTGTAAPTSAPPEPPPVPLQGPPFSFQVMIVDPKAKEPDKRSVSATIMVPAQYVQVRAIEYNGPKNQLSVQVRAKPQFSGPPCRVSLVLDSDRIPGLLPDQKKEGTYSDTLEKDREIDLLAENLQFSNGPREDGLVYLTVDGYKRAFTFGTTFDPQGITTPGDVGRTIPTLRILSGKFSLPDPKFPVTLEVDRAPRSDVVVELGVEKAKKGVFVLQPPFVGDRDQRVTYNGKSSDGGIVLETVVQDWKTSLDLSDTIGERKLRARLLNRESKRPLDVLDEKGEQADAVFADVVLDDSAPKAQFIDLPKKPLSRAATFLAKVRATSRIPIREVKFFMGEPPADGNLQKEKEVFKGEPAANQDGVWSTKIDLPSGKSSADVSVQVVNALGRSSFKSTKVEMATAGDAQTGDAGGVGGPGAIKGTVIEGNRAQQGLEVSLFDDKGNVKAKVKTVEGGEFTFEKLMPGKYKVTCSKEASVTKGEASVTVEADKTAEANIKLFR